MNITNDENTLFLSLCKKIRGHQDSSGSYNHIVFHVSNINEGHSFDIKKVYALAYSLERKGFIKIDKKKYVRIDNKGMEYLKYLRNNIKKLQRGD